MSQLSLKSLSERSIHTSTVPGAKLYIICPRGHAKIYCPWGQAVHPLSQRSGCTSTVPGSGSTSTVPEVRLTSVPGSSCTSTVPEVKLCIHSPHPLFPRMVGFQQNWWRVLCSLLSASWLDSRNQTENVTVMHSSPKLKQCCYSSLATN